MDKGFFRRRRASSVEKAVEKLADGVLSDDRSTELDVGVATVERGPVQAAARPAPAPPRESRKVAIDHDALQASGMVSAHSDRSLIAEEFRMIKRPLILKAFDDKAAGKRPGNLVMVSSARPGEGKTFCAVNLAMSIALERDLTVMLVDGDIAKPSIPSVLGIETDRGLIDLIADDSLDLSDVLLRTDIENLTILPAGRPHQLATELLASDKMERFANDIAKRYPDRMIIFDSPPVLMSSIPGVLALHVGQIVFIVRAEKTTQTSVDSALGQIGECENIYLLLNKARTMVGSDRLDGYHGYYR
jgi:exopolysaccharide/PEP-CTERM locus tyrosine autokinase